MKRKCWRKRGDGLRKGRFIPISRESSVMGVKFFAGVTIHGVIPMIQLESWNSESYVSCLEHLTSNSLNLIGENWLLLDDNDKCHRSKIVTKFKQIIILKM